MDVDAGRDHGVDTRHVLRMSEHRLALRMRHVDRRLGDGRVHVHDGLVFALEEPVNSFMPSSPMPR